VSVAPAPSTRRIKPLTALVASQIAAGEVVERPASVVKELVENALDAGSTRITIELEQGGVELIRITDDGHGIHADDLPLAILPHATSKISDTADLDHIATLGFRGEALASIASVSRLSLRSRTPDSPAAMQIDVAGLDSEDAPGRAVTPKPAAGPVGTSVTVRTLFFNTPARRKFLRTIQTEQTRCMDTVRELAMAHPAIAFIAKVDGRTVLDLPPEQLPRERALAILGKELSDQVLEVHADQFDDSRGVALWGLAGLPAIARATNKSQHIFLNGRCIRDRSIQHALGEAYRGLIEPSRYPTAVLMIEMSPAGVDVNVHPAKAEVRFRDSGLMHSIVLNSVRRALRAADLTPSPHFMGGFRGGQTGTLQGASYQEQQRAILPTPQNTAADAAAFADFFRRAKPTQETFTALAAQQASTDAPAPTDSTSSPVTSVTSSAPSQMIEAAPAPTAQQTYEQPASIPLPRPADRMLQVHNSYVVTQDEHGVVIVDQHALHERVMFEALLARVLQGPLESQRLLTPIVVPATAARVDRLPDLKPLLDLIGIDAAPLGPTQVALHAFASFLFERNVDPVPFMTDLLEKAESDAFVPASEAALRDVLDMMACKAAVKAGDHLSDGELVELLRLREAVERSSNCPHGRPTTVRLTIRELERLFGRS
jgi:DNA mismatch repair protein MutL